MKKILLMILLISTLLVAKTELKEGDYSWFRGGSQAFLKISKQNNNLYTIKGDCYYGLARKYGPNMGDISFQAPLKNGKIIYKNKEYGNYIFTLIVNEDGSFDVTEKGAKPFGHNASFFGHFTSDNLPSFSCEKAYTFVEHAICDNLKIAQLDKKMARTYSTYKIVFYFAKNRKSLEKKLKIEQHKWIKERDKCEYRKTYKMCLENSYKRRIKVLEKALNNFWTYDE